MTDIAADLIAQAQEHVETINYNCDNCDYFCRELDGCIFSQCAVDYPLWDE